MVYGVRRRVEVGVRSVDMHGDGVGDQCQFGYAQREPTIYNLCLAPQHACAIETVVQTVLITDGLYNVHVQTKRLSVLDTYGEIARICRVV